MTLCIAAISRKDNAIVTVSDLMLSTQYMSIDTSGIKVEPISASGRWVSLFAGDPTAMGVVHPAAAAVLDASSVETLAEVQWAFEGAFRNALERKIEGELLSIYGWDRKTFLRRGRAALGDANFSDLLLRMGEVRLNTEFLVAGFGPDKIPRIICVSDPGVSVYHDRLGFRAIGSGWVRALGTLYGTYEADLDMTQLIYRLCEAKFAGESASGVGQKTFVVVIKADGQQGALWPEAVEGIKDAWRRVGAPPIPNDAVQAIETKLATVKWSPSPPRS